MSTTYNVLSNNFQHVGVPFNYNRGNPMPIDNTLVWPNLFLAKLYAANELTDEKLAGVEGLSEAQIKILKGFNGTAYAGQIIAVTENNIQKAYLIDPTVTTGATVGLRPVGIQPEDIEMPDLPEYTLSVSNDALPKITLLKGDRAVEEQIAFTDLISVSDGLSVDAATGTLNVLPGNCIQIDETSKQLEVIINTISCGGAEDF